MGETPSTSQFPGHKRHLDLPSNNNETNSRKQRRFSTKSDINDNDVSVEEENTNSDDVFIPTMSPQISINESRFDGLNVKRESEIPSAHSQSPTTLLRNSFGTFLFGVFWAISILEINKGVLKWKIRMYCNILERKIGVS
jgi:hypothetical protein